MRGTAALLLTITACAPTPEPLALPDLLTARALVLVVGDVAFGVDVTADLELAAILPEDGQSTLLFAYEETLAERQLAVDSAHRLVRAARVELSRPLPRAHATFGRAVDGSWFGVDDPEATRDSFLLPGFDLDACARHGGCFDLGVAEVCRAPCASPPAPVPPAPPAEPSPPASPRLGDCPIGTSAQPIDALFPGLVDCTRSLEPVPSCTPPRVLAWGSDGCVDVGACPAGPWPSGLPASTLYIQPGGQGDGRAPERPIGTLREALLASAPGDTLALSAGLHDAPAAGIEDRTIVGTCPARTTVRGELVLGTRGALRGVVLDGPLRVLGQSRAVSVHEVVILAPGAVALSLESGAELSGTDVYASAATGIRAQEATVALRRWGVDARAGIEAVTASISLHQGYMLAESALRLEGGQATIFDLDARASSQLEASGAALVHARRWAVDGVIRAQSGSDLTMEDSRVRTTSVSGARVALRRVRLDRATLTARDRSTLVLEDVLGSYVYLSARAFSGLELSRVAFGGGQLLLRDGATATVTDAWLRTPSWVYASTNDTSLVMRRGRAEGRMPEPDRLPTVLAYGRVLLEDIEVSGSSYGIVATAGLAATELAPAVLRRVRVRDSQRSPLVLARAATVEDLTIHDQDTALGETPYPAIDAAARVELTRVSIIGGGYRQALRLLPSDASPDIPSAILRDVDLVSGHALGLSVVRTASISAARLRVRGKGANGIIVYSADGVDLRDLEVDMDMDSGADTSVTVVEVNRWTVHGFALSGAAHGLRLPNARGDGDVVWSDGRIASRVSTAVELQASTPPWTVLERVVVDGPSVLFGPPP